MSIWTLTKKHLRDGIWEGELTTPNTKAVSPELEVTHLGQSIENVQTTKSPEIKGWIVKIPLPPKVISDGLQTLVIQDRATGETLEVITLMAGEALAHDIRAEVDLLRAEMEMLKRAFRRHCQETT